MASAKLISNSRELNPSLSESTRTFKPPRETSNLTAFCPSTAIPFWKASWIASSRNIDPVNEGSLSLFESIEKENLPSSNLKLNSLFSSVITSLLLLFLK